MKRALITLLSLLFAFSAFAQVPHAEFKGHQIDGTVPELIDIFASEGYEKIDEQIVRGTFAGERADIIVFGTPKTNVAYQVCVDFCEKSSWTLLESLYEKLNEQLSNKYGKPQLKFEKFQSPYEEGDGYEMNALSLGKVIYSTKYDIPHGTLMVLIGKTKSVLLYYTDTKNQILNKAEESSNIYNDL